MSISYRGGTIDEFKATDSDIHIEMLQDQLYHVRVTGYHEAEFIIHGTIQETDV
ncbi:hypothetical protein [Corynebacterium sp. HMSC055A01]|uniref:hypothetical protein n=1 Tax=Corynebacterium sp. HMSC055A01 TaxID=1715083 RepID=UPI00143B07CB|nr:hypothetical protein [Corynebacterium sp. HMSC055A01]